MAIFKQERHVELVPGAAEAFVVTSEMLSAVIPDELPHVNVFVISVASLSDATLDTFSRVAGIGDLSQIPIGRDAAVAVYLANVSTPGAARNVLLSTTSVNGVEYLSQAATNSYDTLETATDAATALQDRVNALVEAWISFRTAFNAPDPTPAIYVFPRVDATQKTALINAYAAAKQSRYAQQQVLTSTAAAFARAQADYAYKQNLTTAMAAIAAKASTVKTEFTTVVTEFGALLGAGNRFYAANTGGVGATGFLSSLTIATSAQTAMPSYLADALSVTTLATAYQSARQADAAAASTVLTAAQSTQITQTQVVASALATEQAALAAVLAVCPDFDKTSIPYVPDTGP